MKRPSPQLFNRFSSGRFARFIVILFLVYAGVDIANPQLCNEEFTPPPLLLASNVERVEELARHGYKLSPGTLYPLLHGLERKGYLRSTRERSGKSARRLYRATPLGRKVLAAAREKVSELFGELLENE